MGLGMGLPRAEDADQGRFAPLSVPPKTKFSARPWPEAQYREEEFQAFPSSFVIFFQK